MKDIKEIADNASEANIHYMNNIPSEKMSRVIGLNEVNEPLECLAVLKRLNEAISTLCRLQDTDYYLHHIWNSGTWLDEKLKENGFTEEWFSEIEDKLTTLRALLMGDALDYNDLYDELYNNVLAYEAYWHEWYESALNDANQKLAKARKEGFKA